MFAAPRRTDAADAYRRERRSRPTSAPAAGPGDTHVADDGGIASSNQRKRHTKTLTRGDADQMVAAVRVTNRSGAPVTQPTRVTSVTTLGVKQPTVEHPDDEASEWLSEWGDAPAGPRTACPEA